MLFVLSEHRELNEIVIARARMDLFSFFVYCGRDNELVQSLRGDYQLDLYGLPRFHPAAAMQDCEA